MVKAGWQAFLERGASYHQHVENIIAEDHFGLYSLRNMPTNNVRVDREAKWQVGYALRISSVNAFPMLARVNDIICKINSYIRHSSNYN